MKAKLIKKEDDFYSLKVDGFVMATSSGMLVDYKLSKENCDEIFGVVDINKWANEKVDNRFNETDGYHKFVYVDGIVDGYNKSMELNKDKLFTLHDMKEAYGRGFLQQGIKSFNSLIQSLQQPTEIEVEIEQELIQSSIQGEAIWELKLDKNGCLILKKL